MQSFNFHSLYMQVSHSHTQVCAFEHATALTRSLNNEFEMFDAVNFDTQACILQNIQYS